MLSLDQTIEIKLTVNEWQAVLGSLGEMPYRIAAPVIEKVRKQILDIDNEAFGNRPSSGNGVLQQSAIGGRDGL